MSTPITDAAYNAVRSFTNEEQAVDALIEMRETSRELERENAALNETTRKHVAAYYELLAQNAALREVKDAYFKHNNVLVELMTKEQKDKALEILVSRRKEVQP